MNLTATHCPVNPDALCVCGSYAEQHRGYPSSNPLELGCPFYGGPVTIHAPLTIASLQNRLFLAAHGEDPACPHSETCRVCDESVCRVHDRDAVNDCQFVGIPASLHSECHDTTCRDKEC